MIRNIVAAALLAADLLGGCTANQKAIHKIDRVTGKGATVISVDAKQRAIIAGPAIETTVTTTRTDGAISHQTSVTTQQRRFCSEPSPDVYSVVAQALSAGGTFGQAADPRSIELALDAAFSSSENGANIARTQSVNLLREVMFRTCERYLNGAIGELEMSVQAARDQRIIVSILAIEQLTGVVMPRPVVIGSSGNAGAGMTSEAILAYEDARKSLEIAEKALPLAQANFDATNGNDKICDADPVADDNKAKCKQARDALSKAKDDRSAAAERYRVVSALALRGGAGASTVTSAAFGEPSPATQALQAQNVQSISDTVRRIVAMNADTDEFLFFCIRTFSDTAFLGRLKAVDEDGRIRDMCVRYVAAGIREDAKTRFRTDLFSAELAAFGADTDRDFEAFWSKVSSNGAVDPAAYGALLTAIGETPVGGNVALLQSMASAPGREAALLLFKRVSNRWQRLLAGRKE